jgi:hypothetical protein
MKTVIINNARAERAPRVRDSCCSTMKLIILNYKRCRAGWMGDTRTHRERERSERAGAHQNRVKFHRNARNALIISLLSQYGRPSLRSALSLSHLLLFPLLLMLMMVVYFMRAALQRARHNLMTIEGRIISTPALCSCVRGDWKFGVDFYDVRRMRIMPSRLRNMLEFIFCGSICRKEMSWGRTAHANGLLCCIFIIIKMG